MKALAPIWRRLAFSLLLGAASFCLAQEVVVEATGLSDPALGNRREVALTDAMREAVRQGAGVNLMSETKVTDFVLDYDRVFGSAFGYVRNYQVLRAGPGRDGFFEVTIRATVGSRLPDAQDALRAIVKLKGSPRLLIECRSDIAGLRDQPRLAALLRARALEYALLVVDPETISDREMRLDGRDDAIGEPGRADARRYRANYDFKIRAELTGRYVGEVDVFDIRSHQFVLGHALTAVWPGTGEVVAQMAVPSATVLSTQGPDDAASRLLLGRVPETERENVDRLLRQIIARWMIELDSGLRCQLEFHRIDRAEFDRLAKGLRETRGFDEVVEREFDARGIATLEVASRLDETALTEVALRHLPGWEVDRREKTYIQFKRRTVPAPESVSGGAEEVATTVARQDSVPLVQTPAPGGAVPPWLWAAIGAGAVLLLVGVYALGARGKTR